MKVSKYITISDCFRSHEFEVSVDVDLDGIRCAITEDRESESGVLQSFSSGFRNRCRMKFTPDSTTISGKLSGNYRETSRNNIGKSKG